MSKKRLFVKMGCILLVLLLVLAVGCTKESTTPPDNDEQPPDNNEQEQPPTDETVKPQTGGTLRVIRPTSPTVLSYYPEMGPTDSAAVFPGVEMLVVPSSDREFVPFLAKSFVEDPDKLTITFELQEGVKFHDGTEMTADVVKWNYETFKVKLMFKNLLKDIEVVNKYKLIFHLTEWHNQILQAWGSVPIFSQEAYEKNGGAEWARHNVVGTGPFKLDEFQRDVKMIWVKFDDYWQEGQPYLDRIEVKYIAEPTTARAMMLNGEGDIWLETPAQYMRELEDEGFTRQSGWAGMLYHLIPNTVSPNSRFQDIRVREALEYALDKEAICEALGYGYVEPLQRVAPAGFWGGSDVPIREYNPEKARALLTEAGYPDGMEITLLAQVVAGGRNDYAEAIANQLNEAGFIVNLDIADGGRFFGAVFGNGWEDVALMFSGPGVTSLISCHRWWGPSPMTNLVSLHRPDAFKALFVESLKARTTEEQIAITTEIIDYIAEHALVIPVYNSPGAFIHNGKVHTTYLEQGFTRWDHNDMWLEQ